jgi:hypothetical protein
MPQVELSKEECAFLALAMNEAFQQSSQLLVNLRESNGTECEIIETLAIRAIFNSIKTKMESAAR